MNHTIDASIDAIARELEPVLGELPEGHDGRGDWAAARAPRRPGVSTSFTKGAAAS
jgi:hypothetical protein